MTTNKQCNGATVQSSAIAPFAPFEWSSATVQSSIDCTVLLHGLDEVKGFLSQGRIICVLRTDQGSAVGWCNGAIGLCTTLPLSDWCNGAVRQLHHFLNNAVSFTESRRLGVKESITALLFATAVSTTEAYQKVTAGILEPL
jgi:hypothetical protein